MGTFGYAGEQIDSTGLHQTHALGQCLHHVDMEDGTTIYAASPDPRAGPMSSPSGSSPVLRLEPIQQCGQFFLGLNNGLGIGQFTGQAGILGFQAPHRCSIRVGFRATRLVRERARSHSADDEVINLQALLPKIPLNLAHLIDELR